jgi:hypothetical protein
MCPMVSGNPSLEFWHELSVSVSVTDFRRSGARERRGMERRPRPNLDGKATREGEPATLDL